MTTIVWDSEPLACAGTVVGSIIATTQTSVLIGGQSVEVAFCIDGTPEIFGFGGFNIGGAPYGILSDGSVYTMRLSLTDDSDDLNFPTVYDLTVQIGDQVLLEGGGVSYKENTSDNFDPLESAKIDRTGTLVVANPMPDWLDIPTTVFVPWIEMRRRGGDPWVPFYLGHFVAVSPPTEFDGKRIRHSIRLASITQVLNKRRTPEYFRAPYLRNIVLLVRMDIIEIYFFEPVWNEFDFPATLDVIEPEDIHWPPDTPWLDVINAAFESVGWDNISSNNQGEWYSRPAGAVPDPQWCYPQSVDSLPASPQMGPAVIDPFMPDLPNVLVFKPKRNGPSLPVEGNGIFTIKNYSRGPTSIVGRGGFEVEKEVLVEATEQVALERIGRSVAERAFGGGGDKVSITVPLNPLHDTKDVVWWTKESMNLPDPQKMWVRGWDINLGSIEQMATMQLQLESVIQGDFSFVSPGISGDDSDSSGVEPDPSLFAFESNGRSGDWTSPIAQKPFAASVEFPLSVPVAEDDCWSGLLYLDTTPDFVEAGTLVESTSAGAVTIPVPAGSADGNQLLAFITGVIPTASSGDWNTFFSAFTSGGWPWYAVGFGQVAIDGTNSLVSVILITYYSGMLPPLSITMPASVLEAAGWTGQVHRLTDGNAYQNNGGGSTTATSHYSQDPLYSNRNRLIQFHTKPGNTAFVIDDDGDGFAEYDSFESTVGTQDRSWMISTLEWNATTPADGPNFSAPTGAVGIAAGMCLTIPMLTYGDGTDFTDDEDVQTFPKRVGEGGAPVANGFIFRFDPPLPTDWSIQSGTALKLWIDHGPDAMDYVSVSMYATILYDDWDGGTFGGRPAERFISDTSYPDGDPAMPFAVFSGTIPGDSAGYVQHEFDITESIGGFLAYLNGMAIDTCDKICILMGPYHGDPGASIAGSEAIPFATADDVDHPPVLVVKYFGSEYGA